MLLGKDLICQDIVDNLLSWRHSGFSVHGDVKAHDRDAAARWDVYELIARVLDHLPPPRHQLVRYWGYYSNVTRGKRRAAAQRLVAALETTGVASTTGIPTPLLAGDEEPFRRRARLTWAALIKKVYEIDPLLCPFCGAEMKIIAFITEHPTSSSIKRSAWDRSPAVIDSTSSVASVFISL